MKTFINYSILFAAIISISASAALAQRAIVPVERPASSQPQSFYVNVTVDHANHVYEEGDLMKVTVESSKPGYLYLFYKDASGKVSVLFPNRFHSDNHIGSYNKIEVPNANMNFNLETMAPFGKETLQAIVSLNPINLETLESTQNSNQLFNVLSSNQLHSLQNSFSRAIGVVGTNRSENDVAEYTMEITTVGRGQVPQTQSKRVFIGICVARYSDRSIPALPACELDLRAIGSIFSENPSIDKGASAVYVNEGATKEKIRDLFYNYLPSCTNPGDEVIIYWTGHGSRCSDTNGDEKDGYDETLVLYDSKVSEPQTQLIDDEFGRWVQNLSGRKVLFILDTCHSSGMGNRAKSLNSFNTNSYKANSYKAKSASTYNGSWDFGFGECATMKDLGQSDLALIASCAKSEVSLIRDEQDMSVMTWYIVECLKKRSAINHKQLYEEIKGPVHNYVQRVYEIEQNVVIQDDLHSPMILNP